MYLFETLQSYSAIHLHAAKRYFDKLEWVFADGSYGKTHKSFTKEASKVEQ